ncbi:hypothetical protein ACGFYZ_16965 [Streptomyces sp. NPDC048330]|uniref:hypothetical protein n=1 Tax=Streptomyces sp. NPDC048330 TaxID=3365533 RepID=UPI00371A643A
MGRVNLRVVGLGAAVTVAVLLPLVAMAGPTGEPGRQGDAKPGDLLRDLGLGSRPRTSAAGDADAPPSAAGPRSGEAVAEAAPQAADERVTRCGPELASSDGVEAQTCVLSEGPDVWARTYYRNAAGQELDAFLTLMAPGGRTVQVRCPVPAQDEPGTCETPRERGRGVAADHTAVAEFAGSGEGGDTPLLLRSGSNTADAEGS